MGYIDTGTIFCTRLRASRMVRSRGNRVSFFSNTYHNGTCTACGIAREGTSCTALPARSRVRALLLAAVKSQPAGACNGHTKANIGISIVTAYTVETLVLISLRNNHREGHKKMPRRPHDTTCAASREYAALVQMLVTRQSIGEAVQQHVVCRDSSDTPNELDSGE